MHWHAIVCWRGRSTRSVVALIKKPLTNYSSQGVASPAISHETSDCRVYQNVAHAHITRRQYQPGKGAHPAQGRVKLARVKHLVPFSTTAQSRVSPCALCTVTA